MKRTLAVLLSLALLLSAALAGTGHADAAAKKKPVISNKKLTLRVGQKKKLSLKHVTKAKAKKIKWKSSRKKVVSVSQNGLIKAKKKGTAKIMATLDKHTYTCKVTVRKKNKPAIEPEEKDDPTDGDVYYTTPSDFRDRKEDVTYGTIKTVSYYSTTTEKNRRCAIVLPANYDESKKYPVCYLLHGLGQDQTDWLNAKAPTIIGNMIAAGTAKEMILVLPNCRARANDAAGPSDAFSLSNYQAFDNFINDLRDNLMPFIKANYSILEGRENTAIAGFSMGGRTALYIGMSMQETFGYTGGFCPAPGIFAYTMNNVTENGLFTKETFCLKDEYADNTLLMIVGAKNDTIVGSTPQTYHDALVANGTKHIWYRKAGGHDVNVMDNALYNFASRLFNA